MTETTDLSELPPSAKYVYHVLSSAEDEQLTRGELIAETDLPERTIDEALDTLKNRDYVLTSRKSGDLRQVVCSIRDHPDT